MHAIEKTNGRFSTRGGAEAEAFARSKRDKGGRFCQIKSTVSHVYENHLTFS